MKIWKAIHQMHIIAISFFRNIKSKSSLFVRLLFENKLNINSKNVMLYSEFLSTSTPPCPQLSFPSSFQFLQTQKDSCKNWKSIREQNHLQDIRASQNIINGILSLAFWCYNKKFFESIVNIELALIWRWKRFEFLKIFFRIIDW